MDKEQLKYLARLLKIMIVAVRIDVCIIETWLTILPTKLYVTIKKNTREIKDNVLGCGVKN